MPRLAAFALLMFAALPLRATEVDWIAHQQASTVEIVTSETDGTLRSTTVWLCVINNRAYVRGGGGRWVGDAERIADVQLRVGGQELSLRATKVDAPHELAQVTAAFREKYGLMDWLSGVVRGTPTIFRLAPRQCGATDERANTGATGNRQHPADDEETR